MSAGRPADRPPDGQKGAAPRTLAPFRGVRRKPKRPPEPLRVKVRQMRNAFTVQREMALRLVSAAVMIPLVLLLTWYGETAFALVTLVVGALVLREWLRMVGAGHAPLLRWAGWGLLTLAAGAALLAPAPVAAGVFVTALTAFALVVVARPGAVRSAWTAAGLLYAGVAVVALVTLRRGDDGFGVVVFVFLIAWATDTFAYFVGRTVGGPKLWRQVSPSKTWSGALGGLAGGVAFGAVVAVWLSVPLTLSTLLVAALIAAAAQAGDLLESAAKRRFNCKDAGTLIPGHGGVMDRVDGLVTASCVTVMLALLVPGETPAASLLSLMGR